MPKNKWTAHTSIEEVVEASKIALQNFKLRRRELSDVDERNFPRIVAPSGRVYMFGQGSYALLIALYNGALLGEFSYTKAHLQSSAQRFLQENSFFDTFGYTPWSCMGAMWRKDGSVYYHQKLNFRGRRPSASTALYALTPVGIRDAWALFQLHEAHSGLFQRVNHIEYVGHPSKRSGLGSRVNALAARGVSSAGSQYAGSAAASQHASAYRQRRSTNKRQRSAGRARVMSTDETEQAFLGSDTPADGSVPAFSSPSRQIVGGTASKSANAQNAAGEAARRRLLLRKDQDPLCTPLTKVPSGYGPAVATGVKRRRDLESFEDVARDDAENYEGCASESPRSAFECEAIEDMIAKHCRIVDWDAVEDNEPEGVPAYPAELDDLPEDADLEVLDDEYGSLIRIIKHFIPPPPSRDGTLDMTDLSCLSYTLEAMIIGYTTAQAPPDYHLAIKSSLLSLLHRCETSGLPAKSCTVAAEKTPGLASKPACAAIIRVGSLHTSPSRCEEKGSDTTAAGCGYLTPRRPQAPATSAAIDLTTDQSQVIID